MSSPLSLPTPHKPLQQAINLICFYSNHSSFFVFVFLVLAPNSTMPIIILYFAIKSLSLWNFFLLYFSFQLIFYFIVGREIYYLRWKNENCVLFIKFEIEKYKKIKLHSLYVQS